jgi:hypothetical protein
MPLLGGVPWRVEWPHPLILRSVRRNPQGVRSEAQRTGLTQTLEGFLAGKDVSMRCQEVARNGAGRFLITEPWAARQYMCELHGANGDRPISVVIGSEDGPPGVAEVLDALAAASAIVEEADFFEHWAAQMGYDPDSRHGKRVYRAARRQAKLLRSWLGDEGYRQLLWQTERL